MQPALLRVDDAAKFLAVGRSTPSELIARADAPTVHIERPERGEPPVRAIAHRCVLCGEPRPRIVRGGTVCPPSG